MSEECRELRDLLVALRSCGHFLDLELDAEGSLVVTTAEVDDFDVFIL